MTWYHGTRRPFGKGGIVMPRSFHGGKPTTAPTMPGRSPAADAADWVYVTEKEYLAWVYAWHAAGRGRPRVLTVRPTDIHPDPEHAPGTAWRCSSAFVDSVDLHPPFSEAEARGGWECGICGERIDAHRPGCVLAA
jgi:hypothetical protein